MDAGFLFRLFASTRVTEMTGTGWSALQQDIFLTSQFQARQQDYRRQFPAAETFIALLDEATVAALIVERSRAEIHLVDIAVIPTHQNQGIGRRLAADLMAEATRDRKLIKAHALRESRALQFWLKLGFRTVPGGTDLYSAIEWRPKPAKG